MTTSQTDSTAPSHSGPLIITLAWLAVGIPLLLGVAQTFKKALALFVGVH